MAEVIQEKEMIRSIGSPGNKIHQDRESASKRIRWVTPAFWRVIKVGRLRIIPILFSSFMDALKYEFKASYQAKGGKLAKNVNIWVKSFPFCS